jgi:hypothetical protein
MVEHVDTQETEMVLWSQGSHLHFPQAHHPGVLVEFIPCWLEKMNSLVHLHWIIWGDLALESLHRDGIIPRTHPKIDILIGAESSLRIQSGHCPPLGQQRIHTNRLKACNHSNYQPFVDHCLKVVQEILPVKPASRLYIGQIRVTKPPPSQTPSPGLKKSGGNPGQGFSRTLRLRW